MKKFDYKSISCSLPSGVDKMTTELQKLGKQGWELVSVCPTAAQSLALMN